MENKNKKIYTIGFTKKDAKTFFELLRENNIKYLLDIRLNNSSQLAGFAKGKDLNYFLKEILNIKYVHDIRFAPTKQLLDEYKSKVKNWRDYEIEFNELILKRDISKIVEKEYFSMIDGVCFLCSEEIPAKCHRRLIAEFIQKQFNNIEVVHL